MTHYPGIRRAANGKYIAIFYAEGEQIYLGTFDKLDFAVERRQKAEQAYKKIRPNGMLRSDNTSGIRGVYYDKKMKRYVARKNGKRLGCFRTKKEAASAIADYVARNADY